MALQGAAYARRKDYGRALATLDKAIATDDKDALAFGERGQVYLAKGDDNRALADLNRAISLGAISLVPYRTRAMIYKRKGDASKAISDLDAAIGRDPRPADLYFERAALRQAKGDTAKALADLNEGLTRNPNNVGGLRARAQMLMETKAYAKAVGDLDNVIRLDPHNAQGYYQRGLAYERDGDFSKAIADYKTALGRSQKFDDARKALARATNAERQAKATHKDNKPQVAVHDDAKAPPKDVVKAAPPQITMQEPPAQPSVQKKNARTEKAVQAKLDEQPKVEVTNSVPKTKVELGSKPAIEPRSKRERDARLHSEHDKSKRKTVSERKPPAGIRYYRAGQTDMRNSDYHYVVRKRDTRFTDIWKN
jgi:tetratricopeptide (TPR) repeat protein